MTRRVGGRPPQPLPTLGRASPDPAAGDWPGVRLHVVTGKGGTGKTTVAAALALALATGGRRDPARRGRGPAGHRPALRRPAAALRGAAGRRRARRRRGVRARGRARAGAAGVPRDVLPAGPRRPGARSGSAPSTSRRRSRPASATSCSPARSTRRSGARPRRPASDEAKASSGRCTTRSSSTPRRPAGSPASSTSTRRSSGLAKVGPIRNQAGAIMTLLRSPQTRRPPGDACWRRCRCRRPRTPSRSSAPIGLPVGGVVVNMVREPFLPEPALTGARRRRARPVRGAGRPDRRRAGPPLARQRQRHLARGARRRAARRGRRARRAGRAWSTASARRCRRSDRPTYELPALADRRRPRRALRPGRAPARRRGWRERGAGGAGRAAAAPLDVDALLDDPATRVIVCCGAGGVGKTTTAAALGLRAAERGRRVVVLTIDPARRLAQSMGLDELDNMPRPVAGVDDAKGGSARRDDARHEADLRRGRRGARDAREGRADPRQPLLPGALQLVRRHAGVHGDGEARPAAGPGRGRGGRLGPDRRRHPAEPVGAGLPRRARSGSGRSSTAGSSGCSPRPARAGGPGVPQGRVRGGRRRGRRPHQGARRAGAAGRADVRRRPRHDVRRLPRAGRRDVPAAAGPTGRRSSWSPRRSGTRCARPRTSSSGWPPSGCRWPGWCSTGCRRSGPTGCPRTGRRPRRRTSRSRAGTS